ncbi:MAG: type 3 dihydrofolate reductase [Gammaproteobacteria bacterium]|nr:type 3 dihydrofolate reductase [Gammaproteobacteria bacterium]
MRISIIAALAENRVIGVNNTLPWRLPNDLKHFRRLTTGHAIILGRKNYESIGKPLPERTNIVITRNRDFRATGCLVAHSLDEALTLAGNDPEIFVIGGAEIYRAALARTNRLYLTRVHATIAGDTHFPEFDETEWREISRERHERDERHAYDYSFVVLERIRRKKNRQD